MGIDNKKAFFQNKFKMESEMRTKARLLVQNEREKNGLDELDRGQIEGRLTN